MLFVCRPSVLTLPTIMLSHVRHVGANGRAKRQLCDWRAQLVAASHWQMFISYLDSW